mgnify:FL=1
MDNITIRKMRQDDIEQCINIEKSHNIKILSREILENDLKKDSNYYLVATLNNTLIGYIGLSYVLDTADIISIVVKKDYTKKGIASLLLSEIISFCYKKEIKDIFLEVRKSNTPAQALYNKFGFFKISERKKYYNNIEDAYIYTKILNNK